MGALGRILIAVFVILGQTGLVRAYTPCPMEKPQAAACPMTGKANCDCCHPNAKKTPQKPCLRTDPNQQAAKATLTAAVPTVVAAVLPAEPILPTLSPTTIPYFTRPHLVVPRVRTPDVRDHALRAPPAP